MTASHETVTHKEALALILGFIGSAFGSSILVLAAFNALWFLVPPALVLLGVGVSLMWYATTLTADHRWMAFDAAMESMDVLQGADRLRLRVIIHQALMSAIALTGDPRAEDLVDVDQLDYLTERTVDALIATGPVYRRKTDDGT